MSAERSLDGSRQFGSFRGLSRAGAGWHSSTTLWHTGFMSHCVIEGAVLNVPLSLERAEVAKVEPADATTRVAKPGGGAGKSRT